MATLTPATKVFIVQRLACYDSADEIIEAVKDEFGVAVSKQQLQTYNPEKHNGKDLSKDLKKQFYATRDKYLQDTSSIPIANKAHRLNRYQKLADRVESRNPVLALQIYEQAAKECGDMFTNRANNGAGDKGANLTQVLSDLIEKLPG